jgi:hypothetical protein
MSDQARIKAMGLFLYYDQQLDPIVGAAMSAPEPALHAAALMASMLGAAAILAKGLGINVEQFMVAAVLASKSVEKSFDEAVSESAAAEAIRKARAP